MGRPSSGKVGFGFFGFGKVLEYSLIGFFGSFWFPAGPGWFLFGFLFLFFY
jgi:hypothetical protein